MKKGKHLKRLLVYGILCLLCIQALLWNLTKQPANQEDSQLEQLKIPDKLVVKLEVKVGGVTREHSPQNISHDAQVQELQHRRKGRKRCATKTTSVQTSLDWLLRQAGPAQFWRWIIGRIKRLWPSWVQAAQGLAAVRRMEGLRQKRILVFPGVLTLTHYAHLSSIESGGPLGDLLQWADLIAAIHLLGHNVTLASHIRSTAKNLQTYPLYWQAGENCSFVNFDIIYVDLLAYSSLPLNVKTDYKCKFRVVDAYGTEAMYNEPDYSRMYGYTTPFGAMDLKLKQFLTFYPHTPDNSFLGFVVAPVNMTVNKKENIGVLYGKESRYIRGKEPYLKALSSLLDLKATVKDHIPLREVENLGVLSSEKYHQLLDKAKFLIGLGDPMETTGVMEALAHGCLFLNPTYQGQAIHRLARERKPTSRKVNHQVPYLNDYVGPPYSYAVNIDSPSSAQLVVEHALETSKFEPFTPWEFTMKGFLERLGSLIEHQEFCQTTAPLWPPLSQLIVVPGQQMESCVEVCHKKGLVCEPDYFSYINQTQTFKNQLFDCDEFNLEEGLYYPALHTQDSSATVCTLQGNAQLFSCAGAEAGLRRICPCRQYKPFQIGLCRVC